MQSLFNGLYTEDFVYGYPYHQVVPLRAPQLDYSGEALTSAGPVVCEPGAFELHFDNGADNPDTFTPFGGPSADGPGYLRFPIMGWNESRGLFLTITTFTPCILSFSRSFSGYVGDRLVVTVNDMERLNITGSAGYPWTRDEIPLGKGVYRIAIMMVTAPYTKTGVVRGGIAVGSNTQTALLRYMRLAHLQVTALAMLPTARYTSASLVVDSELLLTPSLSVTSGRVLAVGQSALLVPTKISGVFELLNDTTFTLAAPSLGQQLTMNFVAEATLSVIAIQSAHTASYTGGFAVGSSCQLQVNTAPQDLTGLIRPLKRATITLLPPVIVAGRPQTPRAACVVDFVTTCEGVFSLDRIDPYSTANVYPATVGAAATYRWLSTEAQRDPATEEVTEWHAKGNYNGPFWATGGAYRPTVDLFSIRDKGKTHTVRYPAVNFDSGHLDHLNISLPNASTTGAQTWVMVGSFHRYRGDLEDSLPLIDFASSQPVNYQPVHEETAVRGQLLPWFDPPDAPSIYLGLTNYSPAEPTTSRLAWRINDDDHKFGRTELVVVSDDTPMVLIFVLNGADSRAYAIPMVATGAGATWNAPIPRDPAPGGVKDFSLGRARVQPPFGGNFLTGSMSLLEVAYFNRALTDAQARALGAFLAGMYAPVTTAQASQDYTAGTIDVTAEQFLVYAGVPETQLALVTGDRCLSLNVLPSSEEGQATMAAWNAQGVPTVEVTNRDYSSFLAKLEAE